MASGGVEIYLHSFLTLALDRGEWLSVRPGRFTSTGGQNPIPTEYEVGRAPDPASTISRGETSLAHTGTQTPENPDLRRLFTSMVRAGTAHSV
jgi:hypothetical protein